MRCRQRGEVLGGRQAGAQGDLFNRSSAGVLLTSDGGVVIAQFDLAFAENISEVAVAELPY